MGEQSNDFLGMSWRDWDRRHEIRIGLSMTPAERLQWLEDTVEELRPWVGLCSKGRESKRLSTGELELPPGGSAELNKPKTPRD